MDGIITFRNVDIGYERGFSNQCRIGYLSVAGELARRIGLRENY
jgi:hypothetical protein